MIKSTCLKASRWIFLLNILADLSLKPLPPLLQLLDGTVLRKLVRSTAHLALSQSARQQLLTQDTHKKHTQTSMHTMQSLTC